MLPTCTLLHLLLILQGGCQSLALLQRVCLYDPLQHWAAVHWADIPGVVVHIALSPPHLTTIQIGAIPSELSNLMRERTAVRSGPPEYLQKLLQGSIWVKTVSLEPCRTELQVWLHHRLAGD